MAKCDEGYRCEVCGEDVETMTESDLYLRFVIGELDPEQLHVSTERHIRCNPVLAQFIVADDFECVVLNDDFDKRKLDARFVAQREELVSDGWKRLKELAGLNGASLLDYPLGQVQSYMRRSYGDEPYY